MGIYLDIGSGIDPQPGYVGVDLFAVPKGGLLAAMDDLHQLLDNSVDGIYSSHTLEHQEKRKIVSTLAEWYRVLRPGGKLVLEVPDLVWCVENWLKTKGGGWELDAIFGNQDDAGQFHYTGFTGDLLMEYLTAAGYKGCVAFVSNVWSHEQNCIRVELTVRKE